ncbi:hypothetical protein THTE_1214 [Thermogutta terrifontis]|uniref:Uncharacterized protein n=1 Tax=Thermogutta terrifontis TaxID=1331910 RepID=A0A286RCX7_9BACT|nr:hypothetical protein THTE_1214 [Thermogutta terrifontis]
MGLRYRVPESDRSRLECCLLLVEGSVIVIDCAAKLYFG